MLNIIYVFITTSFITKAYAFGPHVVAPNQQRTKSLLLPPLRMSIPTPIDTITSGLASICRTPFGVTVRNMDDDDDAVVIDPKIRIKVLYDIENSPSCRRVRERLTEEDLNVDVIVPATSNARCFTDPENIYSISKDCIIPRMIIVDNNGDEVTVEGVDDILAVLDNKDVSTSNNIDTDDIDTDDTEDTKDQIIATVQSFGNYVATALRIGRGMSVSAAAVFRNETLSENALQPPRPKEPLILYSYEGNQFCRLVREVLTELDVPYELRSTGKGSIRRTELSEITGGSTQCPYLIDPNTDTKLSDSKTIIQYLYQTYAIYTPPNELVQWASDYILPLAKPLFSILAPIQAGATSIGSSNMENDIEYQQRINTAWEEIQSTVQSAPVVVYTYGLSPFSTETKTMLDNMNITYTEISLGLEWIPGLIKDGGSEIRAAFLEKTGQSSLPHIFINGQSIGGLFSGTPGLLKLAQQGILLSMIESGKSIDESKTSVLQ